MRLLTAVVYVLLAALGAGPALAAAGSDHRSEIDLVLPDLRQVTFLGTDGPHAAPLRARRLRARARVRARHLRAAEEPAGAPGDARDLRADLRDLQDLPRSRRASSSCMLEVFIGAIIVVYFGVPAAASSRCKVVIILLFSLDRHRAAATASPGSASASTPSPTRAPRSPASSGKPFPAYAIPLKAGMSIGMLLISVELLHHARASCSSSRASYAGPCFIGFAIGESLGAAALRIAGGIFTKIADIGSDLMKIVFNIKEDDARNPGVIADCTGDNAGDSVGPTRRRLRDLRRHRRRAHHVHPARGARPDGPGPAAGLDLRHAHHDDHRQRPLLLRQRGHRARRATRNADKMNFEAPLTVARLAHLDRLGRA